jgi:undecaprenyl-diphosphatase
LYFRPITENKHPQTIKFEKISLKQAILLGLLQGTAALPGISRSGLTVSYLLIGTKLDQKESLRGSFLISPPVTLGAGLLQIFRGKLNVVPNGIAGENFTLIITFAGILVMILAAFFFGLLLLKIFLEAANELPFDKFLIFFGSLTVIIVLLALFIKTY